MYFKHKLSFFTITHFSSYKSIIFPIFVLTKFDILLSVFFLHFKKKPKKQKQKQKQKKKQKTNDNIVLYLV